jgi:hypothetical protein
MLGDSVAQTEPTQRGRYLQCNVQAGKVGWQQAVDPIADPRNNVA